ncbi:MAG: hypothetical protein II685_03215 [Clostridia bacterium]|nr:hypothetical protein [Clostridia bacterium]
MLISVIGGCSFSKPSAAAVNSELADDRCMVRYGENDYKADITHSYQGVTSVEFEEPKELEGVVYSFSENGCSIKFGDLVFDTDRSFMSVTALPQIITDVLNNISQEGALSFVSADENNADNSKTAVFKGKINGHEYLVSADFESGNIKKIEIDDLDLNIVF